MLEQLYQGLFSDGHFTGSFQDFQSKMEDPEYRKKLHTGIVNDGDFSSDYSTFENKFMGKANGSTEATPTGGPNVMGSELDDGSLVYEYRTEGGKAAWGKSTDGGQTFDIVEAGNIPEEWFEDPKFKEVYKKETSFQGEKIDPKDIARQIFTEQAPMAMKPALYARNAISMIKDLITDKEEREEVAETVSAAVTNIKPRLIKTGKEIQAGIVDLVTADLDGLGHNEKQQAIRDEAEIFMKQKFKEVDVIQKYLIKDTGEGIVKGIKQGDASDFIGGIMNATTSMAETVVPAMATGGASLPFQVIAPMYSEYNRAKAKTIYGEDDPEAMDKLIDNDQTELQKLFFQIQVLKVLERSYC